MSGERFTLDANVLVYSVDAGNGAKRGRALDVLSRSVRRDVVLTTQALGEFYWVAKRKNKANGETAAKLLDRWSKAFPVVHADLDRLREAVVASETHGIAFWDALLWATARGAGCRWLLTEDFQHRRELEGVRFLNPFLDPAPPELDALLG